MRINQVGGWERWPSVKCSPHKHESLSSDPRTHVSAQHTSACVEPQCWRDRDGQIPAAHWCQPSLLTSGLHANVHTCVSSHAYTNTHVRTTHTELIKHAKLSVKRLSTPQQTASALESVWQKCCLHQQKRQRCQEATAEGCSPQRGRRQHTCIHHVQRTGRRPHLQEAAGHS